MARPSALDLFNGAAGARADDAVDGHIEDVQEEVEQREPIAPQVPVPTVTNQQQEHEARLQNLQQQITVLKANVSLLNAVELNAQLETLVSEFAMLRVAPATRLSRA